MAYNFRKDTFVANTATGTQAITGVGFQPKAVLLWTTGQTATGFGAGGGLAIGAATSATERGTVGIFSDDALGTANAGRNAQLIQALHFLNTGGPGTAGQATFTSMDADGFTISWATTVPPAAIIHYIALGGTTLLNARVGTLATGTATGALSASGFGWQPNCVLFLGSANGTGGNLDAKLGIGAATGPTEQGALMYADKDGSSGGTSWSMQRTDRCLLIPDNATATIDSVDFEAEFTSMDSGGFTINRLNASTVTGNIIYLALQGGSAKVGAETQKTSTGDKETTLGFSPSGVFTFGANQVAGTGVVSGSKLTVGGADATRQGATWLESVDAAAPTNTNRATSTTKSITHAASDSTVLAEASITPSTTGFTTNWSTADATAREFLYVALGDPLNAQVILPDADLATTGWTSTPLFSKINDESDATFITATAS